LALDKVVLHAVWTGGALGLWAESAPRASRVLSGTEAPSGDDRHAFACSAEEVREALERIGADPNGAEPGAATLRIPTIGDMPQPSPSLAHAAGHVAHLEDEDSTELADDPALASAALRGAPTLRAWTVRTLRLEADAAPAVLERLEEAISTERGAGSVVLGDSIRFYAVASRLARSLLAEQRFVPMLSAASGAGIGEPTLTAQWQPWLRDEASARRFGALVSAMPPAARAACDAFEHEGGAIAEDFLVALVDRWSRRALAAEAMHEAIEDRDPMVDPHVSWLGGLLDGETIVSPPAASRQSMARVVRRWIGALEDRGSSGAWRLMLRLSEPIVVGDLGDLEAPGDDIVWTLSFHLQSVDNESVVIDAEDIWALRTESATVEGRRVEQPQDLILKELGRASRLDKRIERALSDPNPVGLELTTREAYEFLRESRPLLIEQGVSVQAPEWWETPSARIGARLKLSSPELGAMEPGSSPSSASAAQLGLQALVGYHWQIAIGESSLSLDEFERLAAQRAPLVRIDGRWVEVRPEDVQAALAFIKENPGGEMRVGDALWLAYRADPEQTGLPILGVEASGWVEDFLTATTEPQRMPALVPPEGFKGSLRPYQLRGLSWMAFLDGLGLGPCLADDMGLGKTIQLLALMLHERERHDPTGPTPRPGPTLLVVPMSIVSNWKREADRFAPTLKVVVHHGVERRSGAAFCEAALNADLVITTYSLAHRDRESLELVPWHRLVLDEAQNVKNPSAKQSQAVRALQAGRRVTLTGTPLENRLSELWSIMDFCNPGFLGSLGDFRRHFSVPIERYRDRERGRQLRGLVRPFILRRLKTDPTVISDLPEKVETKEFCRLTPEQASLYEACVKRLLTEVDEAEGIRRRGVVLTALIRLKQICNHPAQLAQDDDPERGRAPSPGRSGKCVRLMELLDEVIASDEQALVFTQFRQMGHILATMLRRQFDKEILFFHGGTPQAQREHMIDTFQKGDGSAPVLVLSLKAGGVGLNLTAASHVFHFDRWWNPAVENQATDRAFRIGQTKTVNVHKFIVSGTLEDRIDQMIESKIALAEDVIGSGEDWLTELSTSQLRDMLALRPDAMADD